MSYTPLTTVSCPQCKKKVEWHNNPYRPFCSERCKLLDLSAWASGGYALPSQPDESDAEEGLPE